MEETEEAGGEETEFEEDAREEITQVSEKTRKQKKTMQTRQYSQKAR